MSGEQFQQWSQSSPLLSLDRFHLKQTPVLNFNCRDSLGFPSYFAQKDFLFCSVCIFKCCVTFLFCCPSGLVCIFKCLHHFSFLLPKWACFAFSNVCIIFLFCCPSGSFGCPQWDFFRTSGGQLACPGARLVILWDPSRMGSFGGPSFFWDFGNTLNFGGPSFLG